MKKIRLGFEVGTGEPVDIPLGHLVCFGQTQQAGKTTTLEALVCRSGVRAIAFVTKRGEGGFEGGNRLKPYLVERTDWQGVQAILESTLQSKQDFKQNWIMRACVGAKSLAGVQANTKSLMAKAKAGFERDMYYVLDNYFDIVVPQIRALPKTDKVELKPGLNVMSLEGYSPELQALVIRSVVEWVHRKEKGVVTIIPEAWRFLPQGRRSPVRSAAEELVREGGALGNFAWMDSQDIAGIDKLPLRAAKVWLIGVQREANELQRNMDNIPAGFAKPKQSDVALLGLGQFYACCGDKAIKTYVQPSWMDEGEAIEIARDGSAVSARPEKSIEQVKEVEVSESYQPQPTTEEQDMSEQDVLEIKEGIQRIADQLSESTRPTRKSPAADEAGERGAPVATFNEDLYQQIKARLMKESPAILRVLANRPEMKIEVERTEIKAEGKSLRGRVAQLIARKFFDAGATHGDAKRELERTGTDINNKGLSLELSGMVALGFLTWEAGKQYKAVPGAKVNIISK